jgi:hypothetical protein
MDRQPQEDLRPRFYLNRGHVSVGWQLSLDVDDDSGSDGKSGFKDSGSVDKFLCNSKLKHAGAVL